jgi:hypothetical protein
MLVFFGNQYFAGVYTKVERQEKQSYVTNPKGSDPEACSLKQAFFLPKTNSFFKIVS